MFAGRLEPSDWREVLKIALEDRASALRDMIGRHPTKKEQLAYLYVSDADVVSVMEADSEDDRFLRAEALISQREDAFRDGKPG